MNTFDQNYVNAYYIVIAMFEFIRKIFSGRNWLLIINCLLV